MFFLSKMFFLFKNVLSGCYGAAAASYNMTATYLAAVRGVLTIHMGCSRGAWIMLGVALIRT